MLLKNYFLSLIFLTVMVTIPSYSQVFSGAWSCDYSTYDDASNGVGTSVVSVGVIKANTFVALSHTTSGSSNFLVGYTDADSAKGRMGNYPYGGGWHQHWISGLDGIDITGAVDIAATGDSLVYVANNDPARNILVFKMGADSVYSTDYRLSTGTDTLWAVTVDGSGYVYVTVNNSAAPGKILVFKGIKDDNNWASGHTASPVATITLPDNGSIRGVAVSPDGMALYASNFTNGKIYCYTGSPALGYTLYNGFSFQLKDTLFVSPNTYVPGPIGLSFMKDKNILFVTNHFDFLRGERYAYGRIYALNPNTGTILDTIDCAKWNYDHTGDYSSRSGGTVGNVSGYTSPYCVAFDENYDVYDQSYFGWAVDKWSFSGTLPDIPLTITGVVPVELTSLSANVNNNSVELRWATATEENNKGFEVQRSTNKADFKTISFIKGNGSSTLFHQYSYTDNSVSSGTYYYRLKQIDFNGTYKYSKVVEVNFNAPVKFDLAQNFPNPFNPSTMIKFSLPSDAHVVISIYNIQGKEVETIVRGNYQAGNHEINFNASNLSSGMYIYTITAAGNNGSNFTASRKMILLK